MIHVISLGAGVQSSTMALMAAHGEITPMPDCAIFADTQWEPQAVYKWLAWLETQLPFPVHRVTAGDIRADQMNKRRTPAKMGRNPKTDRFASLPYFVDQGPGREGRTKRQCTSEYKIIPIEMFLRREVLKLKFRQRAPREPVITSWRGISTDEATRMKTSKTKWIAARYPLAMELSMSRTDCLNWMKCNGYAKPPRSACIGCPHHDDHEWLEMKRERPEEFADAVEFDKAIREAGGMRGMKGISYLHRTCIPLTQVDFEGRIKARQGDMPLHPMDDECEGMCGV